MLEYAGTYLVVPVQRSFSDQVRQEHAGEEQRHVRSDGSCLCIAKRPVRPGTSEESEAFEAGRPFNAAP